MAAAQCSPQARRCSRHQLAPLRLEPKSRRQVQRRSPALLQPRTVLSSAQAPLPRLGSRSKSEAEVGRAAGERLRKPSAALPFITPRVKDETVKIREPLESPWSRFSDATFKT